MNSYFSFNRKLPWISKKYANNRGILYFFYSLTLAALILMTFQIKRVSGNAIYDGLISRLVKVQRGDITLLDSDVLSPAFYNQKSVSRRLQNAVPPGESIIVLNNNPLFFNFIRNRIYFMGFPGNAGPRPGTPYLGEPEFLAEYLRSNKIHYVIYEYKSHILARSDPKTYLDFNSADTWSKNLHLRGFIVAEQMSYVMTKHRVVVDDGVTVLIDLCTNKNGEQLRCEP